VQRGHDLLERIEEEVREKLPNATITIHLEPLEDPRSWTDSIIEPVSAPANGQSTKTR
jgi:divalent metal cation (Fe/Co/Zn/Cd) transporter